MSPPSAPQEVSQEPSPPSAKELAAARELVKACPRPRRRVTGSDGLLNALTETVVESVLDEDIGNHLGYDKQAVEGRNRENSRNGYRAKVHRPASRTAYGLVGLYHGDAGALIPDCTSGGGDLN